MTTTTTDEQKQAIIKALAAIHIRPFGQESCDPKNDAQRNLSGKTHYVDDDTLRWHKSRVLSATELHDGLLYRIITSDALDMHNTERGFRAVVFDVFGTVVSRPKLEEAKSTRDAALNASNREAIDLVAHYREALQRELKHRVEAAAGFTNALVMLTD